MKTQRLLAKDLSVAEKILKDGGLVAIPTETVYGLAANALDSCAVEKIFEAKGRPSDNPLILHISDFDEIYELSSCVSETAKRLADAFWPGPLTMILPKTDIVPDVVTGGLDTVAVRIPLSSVTRKLIRLCGFPLAAPSANLSGKPSPTCAQHVIDDLDGKIDAVLDDGNCHFGLESTVITLCEETPRILRPGKITREDIEKVIGKTEIDESVLNETKLDKQVSSPGVKYKHYSPDSDVIMVVGPSDKYIQYVQNHAYDHSAALCFDEEVESLKIKAISYGSESDYKQHAKLLFDALREFDKMKVKTIYAHCCYPEGVGMSVYNRLIRASEFNVVVLE